MYGSGVMTGMAVTAVGRRQILPDLRVGLTACCAVVAGAAALLAAA